MTIAELKDLIKYLPDTHGVVLSSDEEGNRFHEASGYSYGAYDHVQGDMNDDENAKPNCITLWP